jgi:hypothetical protein
VTSIGTYDDTPEPLTDFERHQLKRLFSDFFEVPAEWKASLRADLERDPPILGTITLGSQGTTQIPLAALSSAGMIGQSNVSINQAAITLGTVPIVSPGAGTLDIYASMVRLGPFQDVDISRSASNTLDLRADNIRVGRSSGPVTIGVAVGGVLELRSDIVRFGFGPSDISIGRFAVDAMEIPDMLLITYNSGPNLTPLYLNNNGVVYQVRVGAAGSGPGGSGRALWIS